MAKNNRISCHGLAFVASLLLSVCCSAVVVVAKPVSSSLAVTITVEISLYFNRYCLG